MFEPRPHDELMSLSDDELDDWAWMNNFPWLDELNSLEPGVRAYLAVALFEKEVQNGGLHQFFFNHPSPDTFRAAMDGYDFFGLSAERRRLEELVRPLTARDETWRESLRTGEIDDFLKSYFTTSLSDVDAEVPDTTSVRAAYVRAGLDAFDN